MIPLLFGSYMNDIWKRGTKGVYQPSFLEGINAIYFLGLENKNVFERGNVIYERNLETWKTWRFEFYLSSSRNSLEFVPKSEKPGQNKTFSRKPG